MECITERHRSKMVRKGTLRRYKRSERAAQQESDEGQDLAHRLCRWQSRAEARAKYHLRQAEMSAHRGNHHFALAAACSQWESTDVAMRLNVQTARPYGLSRMDQHMVNGMAWAMASMHHQARAEKVFKPSKPRSSRSTLTGKIPRSQMLQVQEEVRWTLAAAREKGQAARSRPENAADANPLPARPQGLKDAGPAEACRARLIEDGAGILCFAFARKPPTGVASLLAVSGFIWDRARTMYVRPGEPKAREAARHIALLAGISLSTCAVSNHLSHAKDD